LIEASRPEDGGRVRRVSLTGGGETVERLVGCDDARYSYALVEGPLPVSSPPQRWRSTTSLPGRRG
jgi:hypothetical protein